MLGWKLFTRAVTLLLDNLGDALRVSAVPYAALIAVSAWLSSVYPGLQDPTGMAAIDPAAAGPAFLIAVLNLVVSLWIAVAWHRYVLLEERPNGWITPMNGGAMLGYLGRSILIGLLVALIVLLVSIPLGLFAIALPETLAATLIGSAALFVAMIVFYRLAVVLPAGAVDKPLTFGNAWEATKGQSGTVVVLALLTVGFSLALQIPALIEGSSGLIGTVYQGVVGWIGLMIGVSTLTALYGHLIEGRPVE